MSSTDVLEASVARLLADHCKPATVRASDGGTWPDDLWQRIAQADLPWISVPEAAGGAGGDLSDALRVIGLAAGTATPLPLAETGVLGGWLLAAAGLSVPKGPLSVAVGHKADALAVERLASGVVVSGVVHRVPWGRDVDTIVVLAEADGEPIVVQLPRSATKVEEHCNVAGEPRDTIHLDRVEVEQGEWASAPASVSPMSFRHRGALVRAVQMAAAMDRVRAVTVSYASDRVQFGKPIARFQAVQHLLVELAAEAAIARTAVDVAIELLDSPNQYRAIETAKVIANASAQTVAANAHQIHGAIGVTYEHDLHLFTRRLWAWRAEFGSGVEWASHLGRELREAGADELWPSIASGPVAQT